VSAAPNGSVEREIKLGAWPGFSMPDLADLAPGVRVVAEPALDLDATYFDTADLQLVRNGVSLRRRTGEGAPRWTLKLPAGRLDSVLARREFDVEDPGHVVPAELAALVTGWVRRAPLVPVVVIRSHRERLRLVDADGHELVEIDDDEVSVIDDGHVAARFREVEVELAEHGSSDLMHLVSDALVAAGAGAPDPTSKVVRALGPRALAPVDLATPTLDADSSIGDVVTSALRRSVAQILANDHVIRLDDDIEGVHKARVGTRRLRSDLQTLAPVLADGWADDLRSELKDLAAALGVVRDADVLIERLWRAAETLPAEDRGAAGLVVRHLEDGRRAQVGALLVAMSDDRYVALLDDLVAAALRPRFADHAATPAAERLPELVRPRWRRLRRAVEHLGPRPTDEALHGVRILAKRARYACELAAPVMGDDAADLGTGLARLQDVLGELHDSAVAEEWLRSVLPTLAPEGRFAAGELVAAERAAAAELRAAWPATWAACDRKALTRWFR
jgi:CHAD domain-containing protein